MRLAETERRIMQPVWEQEGITAKELAAKLNETVGWSKTTTYTVINRCIEKNYLRREDPGFRCYPLISKTQVSEWETDALLKDNFDGCPDLLVASLIGRGKLSAAQLQKLAQLVESMPENG